jgi:phage tail-like protein
MTIAAIGTLASSALSAAAAGQRLGPPMGLAFRFTVKIGTLDLGSWQSCSGLKMDFAPLAVKAGGHYNGVRYLAGEVTYPKLVLKRPVSARDSATLQGWLATQGRGWVDGGSATGDPAVVTLYDSYQEPVMKWTLTNARPAAWSGPDLDAGSSKVAVEVLELVHEGFDVVIPGNATRARSNATTARPPGPPTLSPAAGGAPVTFLFPPVEISVTRTSEHPRQQVSVGLDGGPEAATTGATTYVLNGLFLEAADVSSDVGRLTSWASKTATEEVTVDGEPKMIAALPWLQYSWGGRADKVQLTYLQVSYVRFSASGTPVRAKINIKLTSEIDKDPTGGDNPTSGGPAGREARVLVAGDSLPRLAGEKYGAPNRWRALAEANGLDDPLRLRPGRSLYLPAAGEVKGGTR